MCRRRIAFLLLVIYFCAYAESALAEPPPQSVHWGAMAFPDHDPTLTLSTAVLDRFTQFDGAGKRYNDINQTMGFNFFALSWTKPLTQLPGWNLNLTAAAGPPATDPAGSCKTMSCINCAALTRYRSAKNATLMIS